MEVEIFQGMPLQSFYFALFFGLPLVLTLVAILVVRRRFCESGIPLVE
jgi:hypothetical protein